jgi:hypothetical protein
MLSKRLDLSNARYLQARHRRLPRGLELHIKDHDFPQLAGRSPTCDRAACSRERFQPEQKTHQRACAGTRTAPGRAQSVRGQSTRGVEKE